MLAGEVGEVLLGKKPGRTADDEITVAKLVGIGAQDLVAAEVALTKLGILSPRGIPDRLLARYTVELQETALSDRKPVRTIKPVVRRKPAKRTAAGAKAVATLPESMLTGKASTARATDGDKPVFAYIASLPQPQRSIAERVDALAAKTLPGLKRSVKWGISYYGVGDGWCFCCGGFAKHVKLMFMNGVALTPVPPVTPVAMGKATRGVEPESLAQLDEQQIATWMKQVAAVPGVGRKKR